MTALLIPIISPSELRRGPPELPGLIAPSVRELITTVVNVLSKPKGFQMARSLSGSEPINCAGHFEPSARVTSS